MQPQKDSNIRTIIGFFFGIMFISLMLWNRFIRERLPKAIADFGDNTIIKILIAISIIRFIIMIFLSMRELIKYNKKQSRLLAKLAKSPLANKIFDFFYPILENIKKAPEKIYLVFFEHFNVAYILEKPFFKLSGFLMELPIKYAYILTVIHSCFYTIPKVIPPITFIVEILYYHHLIYFYKAIFLYAIVLLYTVLLWILGHLADHNTYFATAHIKILSYNQENFVAEFRKEIPKIEGAIDIIARKNDKGLLEWFCYIYDTYCDIKWLVYRLDLEKQKTKLYERVVIDILYLIGWSYIFYHII